MKCGFCIFYKQHPSYKGKIKELRHFTRSITSFWTARAVRQQLKREAELITLSSESAWRMLCGLICIGVQTCANLMSA